MLVVGVVLVVLGSGNYLFGVSKVNHYREILHKAVAAGGPGVRQTSVGTSAILSRPSDIELLYEKAITKYQYYKIIMRGGRLFGIVGSLLVLGFALRRKLTPGA